MYKNIADGIDLKCKKTGCHGKIHVTFRQWISGAFDLADDKERVVFLGSESVKAPMTCPNCKEEYSYNKFFHVSDEDLAAIILYLSSLKTGTNTIGQVTVLGNMENTNIVVGDENIVENCNENGNQIVIGSRNEVGPRKKQ